MDDPIPASGPDIGAPPPATIAAWRVLARSVLTAISSLDPPATDSDGSAYYRLRSERCDVAAAALRHILGNSRAGSDDIVAAARVLDDACAALVPELQNGGH